MRRNPLFVALTRDPTIGGVTLPYFAVWFLFTGFAFIGLDWRVALAAAGPIYGVMWLVCQYEPRFLSLILHAARKTPKSKNRLKNKGDLYRA